MRGHAVSWTLLGFLLFIGALAAFIGWCIDAGQRVVDRHMEQRWEVERMRDELKHRAP